MSNNNSHKTDQDLGMHCPISRRDFLNGVALTIGGSMIPRAALALDDAPFDPEKAAGYYPPALMGMRGNHDGSYTYAHQLRDGDAWNASGKPQSTGETYDLVIVGGGISGLAAAYFYRKHAEAKSKAAGQNTSPPRILILDNHDDFGGHAKRNEFRVGERTLLAHGGTMSIEHPSLYSKVAMGLLVDLGINVKEFYKDFDQTLYSKLGTAMFYDKATFGEDRTVPGMGATPWPEFLANSPLPEPVRNDIVRIYTEKKDYLPGLTRNQKIARLRKISYSDFLTKTCGLNPAALPFFKTYTNDLFAVGIDAVSALDCYQAGDDYRAITFAGFDGLDLEEKSRWLNATQVPPDRALHFSLPRWQRLGRPAPGAQSRAWLHSWPHHGRHRHRALRLQPPRRCQRARAHPPQHHRRQREPCRPRTHRQTS